MIRSILIFTFLVAAFASVHARANTVFSWNFAGMIASPVPNVDKEIQKKFVESIEKYCAAISGNSDTVRLVNQTVTHTDYYPFNSRYMPLDYSDWTFVRSSGSESYEIKASTNWDYDLPIPMVYVNIEESEQCHWHQ